MPAPYACPGMDSSTAADFPSTRVTGPGTHFGAMKLDIPEGDFEAFIFDCDGTLADTMPIHYLAWTTALGEYGAE